MIDNYRIEKVDLENLDLMCSIKQLLNKYNLKQDIIDQCVVIYNHNGKIVGTVSAYKNTIKLLAVDSDYQGNNLVNKLVTFIIKEIYNEKYNEIFVFSKTEFSIVFKQLGFFKIYENQVFCFFTNRYDLFQDYLLYLKKETDSFKNSSAIVMNANPFTNGHLYLLNQALLYSDFVYIILVKEENKLFSYKQRMEMVKLATREIKRVKILEGSNYLLSKKVFPSYFIETEEELIAQQTELDSYIFCNYINPILKVKSRFVGTEPLSFTTNKYNKMMEEFLPKYGINLITVERLTQKNMVVSATRVRKYFIENKLEEIKEIVPESTFNFLKEIKFKGKEI